MGKLPFLSVVGLSLLAPTVVVAATFSSCISSSFNPGEPYPVSFDYLHYPDQPVTPFSLYGSDFLCAFSFSGELNNSTEMGSAVGQATGFSTTEVFDVSFSGELTGQPLGSGDPEGFVFTFLPVDPDSPLKNGFTVSYVNQEGSGPAGLLVNDEGDTDYPYTGYEFMFGAELTVVQPTSVPLPASLYLSLAGLAALSLTRRKRDRRVG